MDDIEGLSMPNMAIDGSCDFFDPVSVCFGGGTDCDITIHGTCTRNCDSLYDEGSVERYGVFMKYVGNLLYGAIFSDRTIYECNVERLLYRAGMISNVLSEKSLLLSARGCNSNLASELIVFSSLAGNGTSQDLLALHSFAKDIDEKNEREICGVWK